MFATPLHQATVVGTAVLPTPALSCWATFRVARRPLEVLLLAATLLGWSGPMRAQSLEDAGLDSLLRTFASFTDWPPSALREDREPLLICLQGSATLRAQQPISRRGGAGITVRRVAAGDDLRRCHLLFVPASEQHRLRDSVATVLGAPVLIVSDADGALEEGAAIEVSTRRDHVEFEVNLAAAQRNHLAISSKLLRVARRVVHTASNP